MVVRYARSCGYGDMVLGFVSVCDAVAGLCFFAALGLSTRFALVFAGIRDLLSCFMRCPCAGRHLLSLPPQRK
jgi:hypothetical protein